VLDAGTLPALVGFSDTVSGAIRVTATKDDDDRSLVERLPELEADVRYQEPGEPESGYSPGRLPVLLSAPHGAVHTRNGLPKEEDEYTAAFARLVAELTGAHALYARRPSTQDPNWDVTAAYKERLAEVVRRSAVRFVLDLHGASEHKPFGLALGTMHGYSCPGQRRLILEVLRRAGYSEQAQGLNRLDVDHTFAAAGNGTITRFASTVLKVPAAQLEINARLRVVERRADASLRQPLRGDPAGIAHLLRTLAALVRALA
jgi:hypothetical protein